MNEAGHNNTEGRLNSFFGTGAGNSNTTEHNNTFIGAFTNGAAGITNATALGYQSEVTESNSLILGSITGVNNAAVDTKVGIGTTAPVSALNIRSLTNVSPRGMTNEQYNDGMDGVQFRGRKAGGNSTTPTAVQAGDVLGNYVFDGHDGTAFGTGVQIRPVTEESWTSTAHGAYLALWTTPPGSTTNLERLRITGDGNVGIGTANPGYKLEVSGGDAWKSLPSGESRFTFDPTLPRQLSPPTAQPLGVSVVGGKAFPKGAAPCHTSPLVYFS